MRRFVRFQSSVSLTLALLLGQRLSLLLPETTKKPILMPLAIGTSAVRLIGFRSKKKSRWASNWRSRWSGNRKLSTIR